MERKPYILGIEGSSHVSEAVGGFIAWPVELIELGVPTLTPEPSKKDTPKKLRPVLRNLRFLSKSMKRPIVIHADDHLMGVEYDFSISNEDIQQLLQMEMLNISCIELYVKYLSNLTEKLNVAHLFGFLSPQLIAHHPSNHPDKMREYLLSAMKATGKDCYFAPLINSTVEHWMLCVIYPGINKVYWLDSIALPVREEFRDLIEVALLNYRFGGTKVDKKWKSITNWVDVKCPTQTGSTKCGYYVMQYMKDIITSMSSSDGTNNKIEMCFSGQKEYAKDTIDKLREEWGDYLMSSIDDDEALFN